MSDSNLEGNYYPLKKHEHVQPIAYVYSVTFKGVNPVGAVAIVVAVNPEQALKAFKNTLFSYNHALWETNSSLTTTSVKVFCMAEQSQLGRVQILLDGEY